MESSYATARGVGDAIKSAARARAKVSGRSLGVHIAEEIQRRFLSRVFSQGDASQWVLKGGTGLLARVPTARTTTDVDIFQEGHSLEQALEDLKRLAEVDLGDHFRFAFLKATPILAGELQPYSEGYQVTFNIYLGASNRGTQKVDLVSAKGLIGFVGFEEPRNALDLPKLKSYPYRVFPIVDQVADKVCATMQVYSDGRASSRTKDLVDLVTIARCFNVDGTLLTEAISRETRRRLMGPLTAFEAPKEAWRLRYKVLAAEIPACEGCTDVEAAETLVARFINPSLTGEATGKTWRAQGEAWVPATKDAG